MATEFLLTSIFSVVQCVDELPNLHCAMSRYFGNGKVCWQGFKSWSYVLYMYNHVLNQMAESYQEQEERDHKTCTNLKKRIMDNKIKVRVGSR